MLKRISYIVLAIALTIAVVFMGARFGDGPTGPLLGGPLNNGVLIDTPVNDWSFVQKPEVELQLASDSTSRHTWLFPVGNRAYIPAGTTFPPNKQWHIRAAQSGDAIVRIYGQRYPISLLRVDDNTVEFQDVVSHMQERGAIPPGGTDAMWLFAVESRSP